MKKLLILVAVLMLAIPAFSQASRFPGAVGASTTLDADSCDIGVNPAATLLLPYFEVDFNSNSTEAVNTVFTITNTSNVPQVAHVTIWSDWSFPVLDFNIYLTGYDVQGISLYDVIARGVVPITGVDQSPLPDAPYTGIVDTTNPVFTTAATACDPAVSGPIPGSLLTQVQRGLTGLSYSFGALGGCVVGGDHENAVGYVTVDVARTCTVALPTQESYYTADIAFDNVLIGDYQRINPTVTTGNWAAGNPMVHIRAIPEGGTQATYPVGLSVGDNSVVTFPYTFYRRYTPAGAEKIDRRVPLPGIWAARYIEEDEGVGQDFDTDYHIWREGVTGAPSCADVDENSQIPLEEIVRFDESENPTTLAGSICEFSPCPGEQFVSFPETGAWDTSDADHFPPDYTGTDDLGGWTYMNLNHSELDVAGVTSGSQNWVVVNMTAEGRYGVLFDAAWLANGCAADPGQSEISTAGGIVLGPYPAPGI